MAAMAVLQSPESALQRTGCIEPAVSVASRLTREFEDEFAEVLAAELRQ